MRLVPVFSQSAAQLAHVDFTFPGLTADLQKAAHVALRIVVTQQPVGEVTLDETNWLTPDMHLCTSSEQSQLTIPEGVKSFDRQPW